MFWPHRLGSGLEPGVLASQTRLWPGSLVLWCHRLGPRDGFFVLWPYKSGPGWEGLVSWPHRPGPKDNGSGWDFGVLASHLLG